LSGAAIPCYPISDRTDIEVLKSKHEILALLGANPDSSEIKRICKYQDHSKILKKDIKPDESKVKRVIAVHEVFAIGITLLSIGITLKGMVVKTRKIWSAGLLFVAIGVGFLGSGF